MAVSLYPHQLKALGEIHNGSVLKGGVGSGKSTTALAYYSIQVAGGGSLEGDRVVVRDHPRPRDVYVITTGKKRNDLEWEGEALQYRITTDRSLSVSGVLLTVDSWNNIAKYQDVEGAFFIFDEQRLVGSGAWVKAFWKIAKQNEWLLLSATPGDSWIEFAPIFVAHGFYKNRTEFLQQHVVYARFARYPKIDRYVGTGRLAAYRDRVLVDMPFERHTTRHLYEVRCDYDEAQMERLVKDRWNIYEDRPIRDVAELFSLMRRLVNTDPSRLVKLRQALTSHPRLIVFYNFNYELEILRDLASELKLNVAEYNGHRHDPLPETDSWLYLVQYTAGAEGWNCTSTDSMVFFSMNYSYKIFEQAQGRTDRMNTTYTDLYYYQFRSDSMIDKAIGKALKHKKNFNERKFGKEMGWQTEETSSLAA